MKIKCACGQPECSGAVWFEESYNQLLLYFTNDVCKDGMQYSISLDANALLELVREARKQLITLTEK